MSGRHFCLFINLLSISIFNFSCTNSIKNKNIKKRYSKNKYSFVDSGGQFSLERISGLTKLKEFVTKEKVFPYKKWKNKPLEKGILISSFGTLNKKIKIMRPKISQRIYWFNKEKFFSEVRIIERKNILEIKWKGPKDNDVNIKNLLLPKGERLYCFMGQLVECLKETGFFKKSIIEKKGKVFLTIILDGYPFFNRQYKVFKEKGFVEGTFLYDGHIKDGISRYLLSLQDQSILYFVDKNGSFIDKFWISQGLSIRSLSFE
jgi:hypothetical protein